MANSAEMLTPLGYDSRAVGLRQGLRSPQLLDLEGHRLPQLNAAVEVEHVESRQLAAGRPLLARLEARQRVGRDLAGVQAAGDEDAAESRGRWPSVRSELKT
jgi:hypothetical protein